MHELIHTALDSDLQVMLYTGMTEDWFKLVFSDIYLKPIYIKFGQYNKKLHTDNYYSYGVKLASSNQYINTIKERLCK